MCVQRYWPTASCGNSITRLRKGAFASSSALLTTHVLFIFIRSLHKFRQEGVSDTDVLQCVVDGAEEVFQHISVPGSLPFGLTFLRDFTTQK